MFGGSKPNEIQPLKVNADKPKSSIPSLNFGNNQGGSPFGKSSQPQPDLGTSTTT